VRYLSALLLAVVALAGCGASQHLFGHGHSGNLPHHEEEASEPCTKGESTCVFVEQGGKGAETGASCSAAHSVSWLDTESHWSAHGGTIAAGDTVMLCKGEPITSAVEVRGSGSSGKPIELYFASGAKIAPKACPSSGCISVEGRMEYVTINGGTNGVVEATNSGTGKEEHKSGGAIERMVGIKAHGCKHCEILNLAIDDLYVAQPGDNSNNTEVRGIEVSEAEPEYITVSNDTFIDGGWAVNIELENHGGHVYVEHDVFRGYTHGFSPTTNALTGGEVGPVVFAHNRFYDNAAGTWEETIDQNHADGVHCFSGGEPHYTGLYIYDNYVTMEGEHITAPIFLEGGGKGGCANNTSSIWVFDNVLATKNDKSGGNGLLGVFSGKPHVLNNTLIGDTTTEGQNCYEVNSVVAEETFEDNILTTCPTLIHASSASYFAAGSLNGNLYANAASGKAWNCAGTETGTLSTWQSCIGQDAASKYEATAKLKLEEGVGVQGKPEAGSPAIGAGVNLTSTCEALTGEVETACKENILGEARPTSGAWSIGAY
jgi:hypothetical protein